MLKRAANIFGIAFIVAGILGFIPGITTEEGYLLGIFHVDAAHNVIHLVSGAIALWVARQSESASRLYFQIFGVIYAVVALLGLFYGREPLLGFVAHNPADVVLHLVIAVIALYLGFVYREHRPVTA
jgi:hypothetical protein